jgi:hypothetical protein
MAVNPPCWETVGFYSREENKRGKGELLKIGCITGSDSHDFH